MIITINSIVKVQSLLLKSVGMLSVDCPTSVSISPNTAPYKAGGEVTCTSDGYPVSFKWTDGDGNVVSTSSTANLPQGEFKYTCTTSGNFSATCSKSDTISGIAEGKKRLFDCYNLCIFRVAIVY